MIRVMPCPAGDSDFGAHVRASIARVDRPCSPGVPMVAESERRLRDALTHIRRRYPDVWIRRQEQMASLDGTEAWYVFRDEYIGAFRERKGGDRAKRLVAR